MLEYNVVHRFKAEQVARHPWITREQESEIPITAQDEIANELCRENLRHLQHSMFFIGIIRNKLLGKTIDEGY
jgi:hypothetical protein